MERYVYIFHHTDLDGMGVKILGMLYAKEKRLPCKTIACSYGRINDAVCDSIKIIDDVEEIIIGDISVNEDTAERLDDLYKDGLPIRLRDHHDTAAWLNKYKWALVSEKDDNGVARCGTWWLAHDEDMKYAKSQMGHVIRAIDQWDTWKWKESHYEPARQMNSLFSILGENDFTEYIMERVGKFNSSKDLFDKTTKIMLETHMRMIREQVRLCEKFMYTMNLWVQVPEHRAGIVRKVNKTIKLKVGMVFVTGDLSEIGDNLLTDHPEIDVLMMIAFPGLISWRTQKELPIPLGKIAKYATGNGGGHPMAAGSIISFESFKDMITKFMDSNFSSKLDFSNLQSAWERNNKRK